MKTIKLICGWIIFAPLFILAVIIQNPVWVERKAKAIENGYTGTIGKSLIPLEDIFHLIL